MNRTEPRNTGPTTEFDNTRRSLRLCSLDNARSVGAQPRPFAGHLASSVVPRGLGTVTLIRSASLAQLTVCSAYGSFSLTTCLPSGAIEIGIILKFARASGIPMMVIINAIPVTR